MDTATFQDFWTTALSANSAATSWGSLDPLTAPTANFRNATRGFLRVMPYGIGNENDTFAIRIVGWKKYTASTGTVYVGERLLQATCTLSLDVGVAAGPVLDTERYVDTITSVYSLSTAIVGTATDNVRSSVMIDLMGCHYFSVQINTGSSATSANALISQI